MQKLGFLIGRFQIFHTAHLFLIRQALSGSERACDRLLILVGSAFRARSVKNPFSYEERVGMIQRAIATEAPELVDQLVFAPLEDQMYDEQTWVRSVQAALQKEIQTGSYPDKTPVLIGHDKDASSYYLKLFPEYLRIEYPGVPLINSTKIRSAWFSGTLAQDPAREWIPASVYQDLEHFSQDTTYLLLKSEYEFLKSYQASWAHSPYPPVFVTVDALVICQEHVLLIQRGHQPGIGLWAMPGGFLEPQEWIQAAIKRELKEETQIDVPSALLTRALKEIRVFDHPDRAQVGRAITHVGRFDLQSDRLPHVIAEDDAAHAAWIPIQNLPLFSKLMHDDHYYILKNLLGFKGLHAE